MSETKVKPTKGPWTVERTGTGELLISGGKAPDPVTRARHLFIAAVKQFSADAKAEPCWEWPDLEESLANARLIAAAPTMREELLRVAIELTYWLEVEGIPGNALWASMSRRLIAVNKILEAIDNA